MEFLLIILSAILFSIPNFFPALFFLSWFAFIPLIYLTRFNDYSHSFVIALLIGFFNSLFSFYWLYEIIDNILAMPFSFNIFILLLYFFISALPLAIWVLINKFLQPKYSYSPFIAALSWTVIEYCRFRFININPFNYLAYSQSSFSLITKYAAYGGIFLVSFISVLIASYLVKIYLNPSLKKAIPLLLIFFILAVIPFFTGNSNSDLYQNLDIAVLKSTQNNRFLKIEEEINKINSLLDKSKSNYIFTPEKTLSFDLIRNNYYRDKLNQVFRKKDRKFYMQLGTMAAENSNYNSDISNSLFLISNEFKIINRNNKNRNILTEINLIKKREVINFFKKYFNLNSSIFTSKNELNIVAINELKYLNLISDEIFSSLINLETEENDFNLELIINSADESDISSAAYKNLSLAAAVYRAAESKTPLIRVVDGGYSAHINDKGKILAKKNITNNLETFKVKLGSEKSYYQQNPQKIIYIIIISFIILVAVKVIITLKNKISSKN